MGTVTPIETASPLKILPVSDQYLWSAMASRPLGKTETISV
jgi:hypothetical protein